MKKTYIILAPDRLEMMSRGSCVAESFSAVNAEVRVSWGCIVLEATTKPNNRFGKVYTKEEAISLVEKDISREEKSGKIPDGTRLELFISKYYAWSFEDMYIQESNIPGYMRDKFASVGSELKSKNSARKLAEKYIEMVFTSDT